MGVAGLLYPVTEKTFEALRRYPKIAAALDDLTVGCSGLEISRLLANTHYEHIESVLEFIESHLVAAGEIATKVIETKDPIQLDQALAELYLFAHLHKNLGSDVSPSEAASGISRPDIEVRYDDSISHFEVFCPIDFMGFQIIDRYAVSALKYLDIDAGYHLDVELLPTREHDVQYAYDIGNEDELRPWLLSFVGQVKAWLAEPSPKPRFTVPGARASWQLNIELRDLDIHSRERMITASSRTRSTDTRLFFECGTAEDSYKSEWGKRLKRKLKKRQGGSPEPGKLRILALDFSLAETGWPDFISWPSSHERLRRMIEIAVSSLGGELPYDAILPAQLGIISGFADVIWLREGNPSEFEFIARAGLKVPIEPRKGSEDFSDLLA